LAALPWAAAELTPSGTALRLDGVAMDNQTLDAACTGVAGVLRGRGIEAGDVIALYCGNGLATAAAYYGALRTGAIVALVSVASPPSEAAAALRQLRARIVISDVEHSGNAGHAIAMAATGVRLMTVSDVGPGAGDALALPVLSAQRRTPVPVIPPRRAAVILATSGTTGTPRWAVHSHAGLVRNATVVAHEMLQLGPDDAQLGALPLAHSFGMSAVLNASLTAGAAVVLMRHFDAVAARRLIDEERISVIQGVPTMLDRLASASNHRPVTLRRCVVSGAPLPHGLAAQIHDRLCGDIVERYGMTEVSPLTMRHVPRDGGEPGDVGMPLAGVRVRTVDAAPVGELEASAATMFTGYHRQRKATSDVLRDGFFRTGDLGRVDGDGRVTLLGRLKDVIVRGGNNVAAREVERVLEAHPDVVEAAVLGVPDSDLGEEIAAAVVLRRGGDSLVAELESRCADQLASYKRPRHWFIVDSLPRTATGKVRKDQLRAMLS
jgi:long-chain acyl-CoA synthetase